MRASFCAALLAALLGISQALHLVDNGKVSDTKTMFTRHAGDRSCLSTTATLALVGVKANLTAEERSMLPFLCFTEEDKIKRDDHTLRHNLNRKVETSTPPPPRNGIPPDVTCTPTDYCDSGACTTVCTHGSVVVDPWLASASRLQAHLARSLPLCFSPILGTHNSAITLADGYGNLDPMYEAMFKYIKWTDPALFKHSILRTNNQYLSLTDQLNLGVRSLEIDTHWVGGALRIAHCGGLHLGPFNTFVRALNTVAKILGYSVQWDTETLGCNPSLSSIPAMSQRLLTDALGEVRAWMDDPANAQELVMLFFDDQPNLKRWGVAHKLKDDVLEIFPRGWIFTSEDLAAVGGTWPTGKDMVAGGRRLLLVSIADYGSSVAPFIFLRGSQVCGWTEPPLAGVQGAPQCAVQRHPSAPTVPLFATGDLFRVATCELQYGPLNCEFEWNLGNAPYFDENTLPQVVDCSLNMPCPDLLTPSRAAAAIWTWAPGHPFVFYAEQRPSSARSSSGCAVIDASAGRWRAVACPPSSSSSSSRNTLPTVCRRNDVPIDSIDGEQWVLGQQQGRGWCPPGSVWDVPRHALENVALAAKLRAAGVSAGWLPVQGPDWDVDGLPAFMLGSGEEEGNSKLRGESGGVMFADREEAAVAAE